MRSSTLSERVHETANGYKYIILKSGNRISFMDARRKAERSLSSMWRWMSRMGKLARKYEGDMSDYDFDWESIEYMVDQIETLVQVWRKELEKHSVKLSKERRIKQLRDVRGREPEEAAAYLAKADELERQDAS